MQDKILFFGTGRFACPSIEMLSKHHNLLALVTSPNLSPVKDIAQKLGIKIFEPIAPNTESFITELKDLAPDIIALTDYGHILKPEVIAVPKLASINLHPSLLPSYRGPAPIQWAIINGEKWTGVTTFIIDPQIDHGDILLQQRVEILESDTYRELELRLAKTGSVLLLQTINKFKELKPAPQPSEGISYAPKISKETRKIDWHKSATEVINLIRALSPEPAAYTTFRGKRIELLIASYLKMGGLSGKIIESKGRLLVGTREGSVELKLIKPEAKREQTAIDFINGYRPQVGEIME